MGWLFGWNTRKELADHLLRGNGLRTIKHCFKGNNLWAVQAYTYTEGPQAGKTVQFIALYLIRGSNNSSDGWGYKDMDESAGPYYYNCPLAYLDMVPDPGGYATDWRAEVRKYHAKANQKLVEGQRIKLYGQEYTVGESLGRRGWHVWQFTACYRLKPSQLKHVEVMT